MTDIRLRIKAVQFVLKSFAWFSDEQARTDHMKNYLEQIEHLDVYLDFSKQELKHVLKQLQEKENQLQEKENQLQKEKNLLQEKENQLQKEKNLLLHAQGQQQSGIDCTDLKNALLSAKVEGGFLCLSGSTVFPVSLKEANNRIPSKLLIRSFQSEVKLILKKLRSDRKEVHQTGGAIFFGPSGTGKSWTSQAVLVDELKEAEVSGKAVVYFDSAGERVFVFSKEKSVLINSITHVNEADIPELMRRDTVLIYDAAYGSQDKPPCFPCEWLIFSSPITGDFKQVASNNGLRRFVCPNWTLEELQLLERGYGDRVSPQEIASRFERFGGSPRAVVSNKLNMSLAAIQEKDARLLLKGIHLWSELSTTSPDWPCTLLKAQYNTDVTAVTPEEAFNKYLEENMFWGYTSATAMELVHAKFDEAHEATQLKFQSWLRSELKTRILYRCWFEHRTHSLFVGTTDENVEVKVLERNDGLCKEDRENLTNIVSHVNRNLAWKIPQFKEIYDAPLVKKGKKYNLADLKRLTDPAVLYRLPDGFPLMNYFNPPNNCFSLGVGGHTIHLDQAVILCSSVVPATHQVNFVYVTPSINYDNVKRWQSFNTSNGGTKALGKLSSDTIRILSRMVQFCMKFKKC